MPENFDPSPINYNMSSLEVPPTFNAAQGVPEIDSAENMQFQRNNTATFSQQMQEPF